MTFAELKAALVARGFDYLETAGRTGDFINNATQELDEIELWPYREASVTGDPPIAIADLGTVELVLNTSNANAPLAPAQWSELVGMYGDTSITGSPSFYYVAWPSGVPTVATYPESSDTIGVQYFKVTTLLSGDSDVPLAPDRFHKIIVDIAVRDAYRDSDNHQAAEQLQLQIDRDLNRMRMALFTDQIQGPTFIRIVAGSEDS